MSRSSSSLSSKILPEKVKMLSLIKVWCVSNPQVAWWLEPLHPGCSFLQPASPAYLNAAPAAVCCRLSTTIVTNNWGPPTTAADDSQFFNCVGQNKKQVIWQYKKTTLMSYIWMVVKVLKYKTWLNFFWAANRLLRKATNSKHSNSKPDSTFRLGQ